MLFEKRFNSDQKARGFCPTEQPNIEILQCYEEIIGDICFS